MNYLLILDFSKYALTKYLFQMLNTKRYVVLFATFFFVILGINQLLAGVVDLSDREGEPTLIIHDTTVAPGELLLQIDALNFVEDNGQVAAITLRIEIDTFLIQFNGIQNKTLVGSWLANYNVIEDEITITYTAPFGMGFDIDGKLLDLRLEYFGGFPADLHFKANCEVSNVNLQTISGIVYEDGRINQITPVGNITQDTVIGLFDQSFSMPLTAEGAGYDMVNKTVLRVAYDSLQLQYAGFDESALSDATVVDNNGVLIINWEDNNSPMDFTSLDTLLYLNFLFIGDTNTSTLLLPGSKVYNNDTVVASGFFDGYIKAKLHVQLYNAPDTAGTVFGSGYYFPDDTVTAIAVPDAGFHFLNWSESGSIVSSDSVYVFVKQFSNDTLTANYAPNLYNLTLIASPIEGGEVIGAGIYAYGETVSVTAVPAEGYTFMFWENGVDTLSFDFVYTFIMPNSDLTLTAVFEIDVYTITAVSNNPDYGSAEGGGDFNYGDIATVTAKSEAGFMFVVWTEEGQAVSYDSVYSFAVHSSRDLVANFQYETDCSAPVALYVDSLAETSALLHWLPSGNESEWDIIWGEAGFDTIDDGELVEGLLETKYLLENLDPGTLYDFYVRAICTDELHSVWAGPHTFSTWYVGIETQEYRHEVIVYPNPVAHDLHITFNENTPTEKRFQIINLVGLTEKEGVLPASNQAVIYLDDLSPGVYILRLFLENKLLTKIFVKN